MDEQSFWQLVAEYLRSQQTTGAQWNPGGDLPYDDYGFQDQIGGFGPVSGTPIAEDWGDTGIGGAGFGTGANLESATSPYLAPPPQTSYQGGRPVGQQAPGMTAALGQMQQGLTQRQAGPNPWGSAAQQVFSQPATQQPSALQGGRLKAAQVVSNLSRPKPKATQPRTAPYPTNGGTPSAPRQAPAYSPKPSGPTGPNPRASQPAPAPRNATRNLNPRVKR